MCVYLSSPMKNHESEPSLVETENKTEAVGPRHLTESQSRAFHELAALCQLAGHGEAYGGFVPRTKPLLLGPSGCGKSALVGRLADTTGLPLLRINSGSWVVYSARGTPYTLDVIRRFVCTHPRGIILLDEIDKCVPSGQKEAHSDWDLSVFTELLSLYDACPRLLTSGWQKPHVDRLKSHFLIGAGAWQKQVAKAEANQSSHAEEVSKDFGIPAELAYRFNARPVVLELPNRTDFTKAIQRVHTDLGLDKIPQSKIDDLVTRAVDAKCGLRWLEQYVSDLLSAHPHLRRQSPPSAAEPSKQSKTPTSLAEYKAHQEHIFELLREAEHVVAHLQVHFARLANTIWPANDQLDLLDERMTADKFAGYCQELSAGLHYRYSRSEKERDVCIKEVWSAGHRVLHFICEIINQQPCKISGDTLNLAINAKVRLGRILSALSHLGSLELSSE